MLAASEDIGFVPGRLWREDATGTNGVGTAIAVDHPVQIFSAEHFSRSIHGWTCSGAPVHDPETGKVLGVIDLSSGIRAAHPHSLALVTATARMVEERLRRRARAAPRAAAGAVLRAGRARRATPCALVDRMGHVLACHPPGALAGRLEPAEDGGWREVGGERLDSEPLGEGAQLVQARVCIGRPRTLRLRALGRDTVEATVSGQRIVLPRRRSEIVVLLALHPEGLTAEQLARELYGDEGKRMSVRSEISRLRRQLGGLLGGNPYRLLADVRADFLEPPWVRAREDAGLLAAGLDGGVDRDGARRARLARSRLAAGSRRATRRTARGRPIANRPGCAKPCSSATRATVVVAASAASSASRAACRRRSRR